MNQFLRFGERTKSNFGKTEPSSALSEFVLDFRYIFTALHVMQTRSSDENSVCPSVCLSVCLSVRLSVTHVNCDKTVERSVQIYIPYERTFSLVF